MGLLVDFEKVSPLLEKAAPFLQSGIVEPFIWFVTGAAVVKLKNKWDEQNARKAIKNKSLLGPYTVVGETLYMPSGRINPETGQEFFNQAIRNYMDSAAISDIFNQKISGPLVEYIDQARKFCTPENPVVFSHLDKVVPAKDLDNLQRLISRQWVNYFSAQLSDPSHLYSDSLGPREKWGEISIRPVLTYEPDADLKQYRILLLPEEQLHGDSFPDAKNIRVPAGDYWVHDPDHYQLGRLKLHLAITKVMQEPGNEWIRNSVVNVRTHEKINVPPVAAQSPHAGISD